MPQIQNTSELYGLQLKAWRLLSQATAQRGAPLRLPMLATVSAEGQPQARVVVLRRADPDRRRLEFHTDVRSEKIASLEHNHRAGLTFWDQERNIQIRAEGPVTVSTSSDEGAGHNAWIGASEAERETYAISPAPGRVIEHSGAYAFKEPAQENFRLCALLVTSLDWLSLSSGGHERAHFRWSVSGALVEASWRAP